MAALLPHPWVDHDEPLLASRTATITGSAVIVEAVDRIARN
jgi:hypothetical protein